MKPQVFVIATLLFAPLFHEAAIASNVTTYRNDQLGFEISYFDNWEQSQASGNPAFFAKRTSDKEPATISVNIANFSGNKDNFMRELKEKPKKFLEEIKQRFPSAELLDNGDIYLGGFPAYFFTTTLTLTSPNVEIDIVIMQIFCIKGGKIYLVHIQVPSILFERLFNEFLEILATFNFR